MAIRKTVESKDIPLQSPVEETQVSKPNERQIAKKRLSVVEENQGIAPADGTSTDRAASLPATSTVTDGESG
ncbi:MAG: hypothetical protein EOP11_02390 [Proteobacteria bacterium]|nr:MAG: hypothetical protein EOP11_02390 [Pseudomonadota bacterium]